ncbi:MAG: bifunctional demethylmenaquinone methyltransferase/2-methoxy-6-polyprenyl-1,4-benzoquinol methylase [Gammaproteobacteria bacterium RIFCSPHIGHO2_12_FULL_38_14]|nr:MAG: bifunctional demethylmenaquinone methyltransferase/2-methoxy-6-polyprenyl-1,4-benzoquinol methylase [Gammaproteobacteria bacterium RIFCSPHIGHO2_12_FULL_38_14]
MPQNNKTTDFGYRHVSPDEKSSLVAEVFHSVANRYDLMNDIMSFGLHRLWKRIAVSEANIRPGQFVLDVASGTGDLVKMMAKEVGPSGKIVMTDINDSMLAIGRDRLIDAGYLNNIVWMQADAEHLPFQDQYFDCITIAFGLRNVTDKTKALTEFYRVLKPGGRLIILEFSQATSMVASKLYDLYSFHVIPQVGKMITKDKDSYQYLVESIRMHPHQSVLKAMMIDAHFEDVDYINLCNGIVAIHKGYKY